MEEITTAEFQDAKNGVAAFLNIFKNGQAIARALELTTKAFGELDKARQDKARAELETINLAAKLEGLKAEVVSKEEQLAKLSAKVEAVQKKLAEINL